MSVSTSSVWFNVGGVGGVSEVSVGLLDPCDASWSWNSSVSLWLIPICEFWPSQASNLASSSPGKQMTTKYQCALKRRQTFDKNNVTHQKHSVQYNFFMYSTHSWLTGTNRKSFLKMSTWRVHVFTRWCRLCLWQLSAHKNRTWAIFCFFLQCFTWPNTIKCLYTL